jgi:hypothetical protein
MRCKSTCGSSPGDDSLLAVYAVGDPTSEIAVQLFLLVQR